MSMSSQSSTVSCEFPKEKDLQVQSKYIYPFPVTFKITCTFS